MASIEPTGTVTSQVLRDITRELANGRHVLVTGPIGDLVLLRDDPMLLGPALVRMGSGSFDVVVQLDAVDGIRAVHGADAYERLRASTADYQHDCMVDLSDREARLRDLQARVSATQPATQYADPIVIIRRLLAQNEASVLVIIEQADILLQDPAHHDTHDRLRVARLQMAMREATRVGQYRNGIVMLAGEAHEIPPVLLAGLADAVNVNMNLPTRAERERYVRRALAEPRRGVAPDKVAGAADQLAALTDGDPLTALRAILDFSDATGLPLTDPRKLVDLQRFGARTDHWGYLKGRLEEVRNELRNRVFGQEHAVTAVVNALAAAALGLTTNGNPLGNEGRPKGAFLFVGPTGVGKTEMAKAIAEILFHDPEAYVRIDCATLSQEHSAERLTGAAPGYIGFERGGELTNAVLERPNRIILLDEIDKAHPSVFRRIMSVLDDGRVTDGQGRTAYFSQSVVIMTSNQGSAGVTERAAVEQHAGRELGYADVKDATVAAVRDHVTITVGPEVFGRLEPGVIAFDVFRDPMIDPMMDRLIRDTAFRTGPDMTVDRDSAIAMMRFEMSEPKARELGGRQIRNVWERRMSGAAGHVAVNALTASSIAVWFEGPAWTTYVSVDGGPPIPVDGGTP